MKNKKIVNIILLIFGLIAVVSCNSGAGIYSTSTTSESALSVTFNDHINISSYSDDPHTLVGVDGKGITVGSMGYVVYEVRNNTSATLKNMNYESISNIVRDMYWIQDSNILPSCTTPTLANLGPYASCYYTIGYSPKYQGVSGNLPFTISYTNGSKTNKVTTIVPFKSRITYNNSNAYRADPGEILSGFTLIESTLSIPGTNTKTYILTNNTNITLFALSMNQEESATPGSVSQFYSSEVTPKFSTTVLPSSLLDPSVVSTCMSTYWYDQLLDPTYTGLTDRYLNLGIYGSTSYNSKLYDRRIALQPGMSCSIIVNLNATKPLYFLFVSAIVESGTSYSSNTLRIQ